MAGIGPRDASLILRSSADGNLTGTETDTVTMTKGIAVQRPLAVNVVVPQASTSDTLKVTAKCTTAKKKIEVTHTDVIDDNSTFPYHLILPLSPSDGDTWDVVLTITGSSVNFGEVDVWIEQSGLAKVDA